jgi:hypothetical protein
MTCKHCLEATSFCLLPISYRAVVTILFIKDMNEAKKQKKNKKMKKKRNGNEPRLMMMVLVVVGSDGERNTTLH